MNVFTEFLRVISHDDVCDPINIVNQRYYLPLPGQLVPLSSMRQVFEDDFTITSDLKEMLNR